MSLAQTPIEYDPRETLPTGMEGRAIAGTNTAATLVRLPDPTFSPYRYGVGETRVTASSLYPANGIDDSGEVVVHEDLLEPLERARERVREAGFEIAVVSGFSGPARAQRKFVELSERLHAMLRAQKGRGPTAVEEIKMGRLASTVGTPALLSSAAHPKKTRDIHARTMLENFAGLIAPPKHDVFNLAYELQRYRGNVRPYSDRYTDNICPPIISTAVSGENFGRTLQCVLTALHKPERVLNMGIGVDIPDVSLQAANAFEEMNMSRLEFLLKDNPLALEYFRECDEPKNQETLNKIKERRRVLYNAMTLEGFVREKRQGLFTLPAEPTDMPPRHHMLNMGLQFGHKW